MDQGMVNGVVRREGPPYVDGQEETGPLTYWWQLGHGAPLHIGGRRSLSFSPPPPLHISGRRTPHIMVTGTAKRSCDVVGYLLVGRDFTGPTSLLLSGDVDSRTIQASPSRRSICKCSLLEPPDNFQRNPMALWSPGSECLGPVKHAI